MLLFQLGICIFGCGSLEKMTRISLRTGSGLQFKMRLVLLLYPVLYNQGFICISCSCCALTLSLKHMFSSSTNPYREQGHRLQPHLHLFISSHQPSNQHAILVAKVQLCLDNNTKLWETWQPGTRGEQANMCLTNVCLIIPCMQP